MDDKIPTFKLILVGDSGTIINIILTIFFFFYSSIFTRYRKIVSFKSIHERILDD